MKKDISFLFDLNERLNESEKEVSMIPNISLNKVSFKVRNPRESEKLDVQEMENILNIVQRENFSFYPIGSNFGFFPSYVVGKDNETILQFSDRQLPEDYNFDKLSQYFDVRKSKAQIMKKESYYY